MIPWAVTTQSSGELAQVSFGVFEHYCFSVLFVGLLSRFSFPQGQGEAGLDIVLRCVVFFHLCFLLTGFSDPIYGLFLFSSLHSHLRLTILFFYSDFMSVMGVLFMLLCPL